MSELLPVPPILQRDRSSPGKRVGDLLRSLGSWTDPSTGQTYPIRLESDGEHYSVGISTGVTFRVSCEALTELGTSAFDRVRQVAGSPENDRRGSQGPYICLDERRGSSIAVFDGDGTWTLEAWYAGM